MKEGSVSIDSEVSEQSTASPMTYPKANILNRFIAKFIDALIVGALYELPLRIGFLAGLAYLLLSDGFSGGRSPGKQMIGLRVALRESGEGCSFKESMIRNGPLALAYLLFSVPYIGWLPAALVLFIEGLLVVGNGQGLRLGDEMAGTKVLDQDSANMTKE